MEAKDPALTVSLTKLSTDEATAWVLRRTHLHMARVCAR